MSGPLSTPGPDPMSRQLADAGAAIARRQAEGPALSAAEQRELFGWLLDTLGALRAFAVSMEDAGVAAAQDNAATDVRCELRHTIAQGAAATVLYHRLGDMETPTDARVARLDPAARRAEKRAAGGGA